MFSCSLDDVYMWSLVDYSWSLSSTFDILLMFSTMRSIDVKISWNGSVLDFGD